MKFLKISRNEIKWSKLYINLTKIKFQPCYAYFFANKTVNFSGRLLKFKNCRIYKKCKFFKFWMNIGQRRNFMQRQDINKIVNFSEWILSDCIQNCEVFFLLWQTIVTFTEWHDIYLIFHLGPRSKSKSKVLTKDEH